jgi:hypothetical protein
MIPGEVPAMPRIQTRFTLARLCFAVLASGLVFGLLNISWQAKSTVSIGAIITILCSGLKELEIGGIIALSYIIGAMLTPSTWGP